ncbi:MAG: hypothetical protein OXN97_17640 [Bryobacterales bacterium]|nr:hypothetical protein [Bryobacterales bacterium]MDE0627815.1 hypothetical protein [Bryobacterales bacterium]
MPIQSIGKSLRLRRILRGGRAVVVAMDHGNAAGAVRGLEHPAELVRQLAPAGADAILVTPGILEQVCEHVGDLSILLRIDGCVSPLVGGPMRVFVDVEQAVSLGADAVVMNATLGASFEGEELEKVGTIASQSRTWGMPVVAEILSNAMMANHMDMSGQGEDALPSHIADDITLACRIGAELGSDLIKTRYSGDVEDFRKSVDACGVPVLVAGGPNRGTGLGGTLDTVSEVLEAGASGVIFGRQIFQHEDPVEAVGAVAALVHGKPGIEAAV